MKKIVLLRHGESAWNKENRFTGWTDVDLTEKGIAEACKAGELLKENGFNFDKAYTSYLKRAVKTLNCVLDRMGGHAETLHFFHLERDVGVDEIVAEHSAAGEEFTILVEIVQCLVKN